MENKMYKCNITLLYSEYSSEVEIDVQSPTGIRFCLFINAAKENILYEHNLCYKIVAHCGEIRKNMVYKFEIIKEFTTMPKECIEILTVLLNTPWNLQSNGMFDKVQYTKIYSNGTNSYEYKIKDALLSYDEMKWFKACGDYHPSNVAYISY